MFSILLLQNALLCDNGLSQGYLLFCINIGINGGCIIGGVPAAVGVYEADTEGIDPADSPAVDVVVVDDEVVDCDVAEAECK